VRWCIPHGNTLDRPWRVSYLSALIKSPGHSYDVDVTLHNGIDPSRGSGGTWLGALMCIVMFVTVRRPALIGEYPSQDNSDPGKRPN
jgi:hypothetical protein